MLLGMEDDQEVDATGEIVLRWNSADVSLVQALGLNSFTEEPILFEVFLSQTLDDGIKFSLP